MLKILYLCTHNRCRSIIAEAVTNSFNDDRLIAFSAGSQPAEAVHPLTLKYLQQRGIDTAPLFSKSWDEFESSKPNVAITMCDSAAGEACPVWLNSSNHLARIHWGLSDPSSLGNDQSKGDSNQQIEQAFNKTIDIIQSRISTLLEELATIENHQDLISSLKKLALKYPEPIV